MILILQSTTFGAHGGIPTYNRVVCRVLNELADPIERQVLLATDTPGDLEPHRAEYPHLTFTAFSGKRVAFVRKVLRLVLTRKINLLLIGHVNYAPLGLLVKFLRPSLRYGVMVHGVDVWSRLPRIRRQALQRADFISSVSEYTKQQAVSVNGIDPQRVYLLPNALEWKEGEGEEVALPGLAPSGIRLLSVCRFSTQERYKGVDTVIEALPLMIDSVPNVQYFIIGAGADLERHKDLALRLGVADRVHFLGSVDTPTLRAHYKACDIFVMPSAGEGFGIVFLEAMRYAKPIVAAESGAVPEVIQDGQTGKVIPYGNKALLGGALVALCLNADERRRLGKAGYQRLQDNFTLRHFREKFSAILLQELSSNIVP